MQPASLGSSTLRADVARELKQLLPLAVLPGPLVELHLSLPLRDCPVGFTEAPQPHRLQPGLLM